jgi:hypothetical protein
MNTAESDLSSNVSRRRFLQAGASLSALSMWGAPAQAQTNSSSGGRVGRGVFFDREELPRIRASLKHPAFAPYWKNCREADLATDRRFLVKEVDLMNRVRDLARVVNIAFRAAFVHVIEPNEEQRALAELAVATALKFNRWDWILEDGVHTVGVMRGPMVGVLLSCALDWLGDGIDSELRGGVMQRLGDEIGPASFRAVHGELGATPMPKWTMDLESTGLTVVDVSQWPNILADTNLQIIATSGLLISASMLPDHPDATKWRKLAQRSLREFIAKQPADGSFDEGSAYWGFTYNYFCLCLELLRRFHDIDERGMADFPAMARYFLRSTMPTHETPRDTLSIGDCSNSGSVIALAWIGREFRDSTAQHLLTRPGMATTEPTLCWAAIWFDPTVPKEFAADMRMDYTLAPGLVVSRTGWTEQDSVLCLRSGEPCNHEHADRNSLLFAAFGERLLNDPIKASYDPQAPGWLLRQTEAHTSLLIDGRGHIYHHGEEGTNASLARAHITAHQIGLDWMTTTSDVTEAYRLADHPVERVVRTVVFLKPDLLVVFDAVDLERAQPVEIRFQAFNRDGQGTVMTDDGSIRIKRPRAGLKVVAGGNQVVSVRADKLDLPADMPIYPFGAVTSEATKRHRVLSVCAAHSAGEVPAEVRWREEGGNWLIAGERNGKSFEIRLAERSAQRAPAISVTS